MKDLGLTICILAAPVAIFGVGFRTGQNVGRRDGAKLALEGKAYTLITVTTNTTVRFEVEP